MKKLRTILLLGALVASACAERLTPPATEPPTPAGPGAPPPPSPAAPPPAAAPDAVRG